MKLINWHALAIRSLILFLAVGFGANGRTANHEVWMESYGFFKFRFVPNYLEIQVGDSVTWRNEDYTQYGYSGYDATCYSGPNILWSTGLVFPSESASLTFPFVATYSYRDSYYGDYGMNGTLVVKPAVVPPTGATLLAPQWFSDGRFQCLVSNLTVGKTYIMQVSSDLVAWTGIATNTAAASVETFTHNPAPAFGAHFYRSWHLP